MKGKLIGFLFLVCVSVMAGFYTANAWTPLAVKNDYHLFIPGSQPGQGGTMDTATRCDNCTAATTRRSSPRSIGGAP